MRHTDNDITRCLDDAGYNEHSVAPQSSARKRSPTAITLVLPGAKKASPKAGRTTRKVVVLFKTKKSPLARASIAGINPSGEGAYT